MDCRSVSELTVDELVELVAERVMERLREEADAGRIILPDKRYSKRRIHGDAARKWGYTFGVDGVIDEKEVRRLLGGISGTTVDRRVAAGLIRKGKDEGRVVYCRRSVENYLKTLER